MKGFGLALVAVVGLYGCGTKQPAKQVSAPVPVEPVVTTTEGSLFEYTGARWSTTGPAAAVGKDTWTRFTSGGINPPGETVEFTLRAYLLLAGKRQAILLALPKDSQGTNANYTGISDPHFSTDGTTLYALLTREYPERLGRERWAVAWDLKTLRPRTVFYAVTGEQSATLVTKGSERQAKEYLSWLKGDRGSRHVKVGEHEITVPAMRLTWERPPY